jgi:predicted Zn finger-like uncharacterized protein
MEERGAGMFARIQCPHCKKKISLKVYLFQLELNARKIPCSHCGKTVATKFHHRVHITGYQLLSLSGGGGFLIGIMLELSSALHAFQDVRITEGVFGLISSALLFTVLFVVLLGLPLLYLGAPALQYYLDSSGRRGSRLDTKSEQPKKKKIEL